MAAVSGARAQDSAFHNFFGNSGGGSSNTYDREFIKEWEINPPKA